jgi:hypothetical protein
VLNGLSEWPGLERSAGLLREHADPLIREEAEYALSIAERHLGRGRVMPPPSAALLNLEQFRRDVWLGLFGHVVQSTRDADPGSTESTLAAIAPYLSPPREWSDGDAMLVGAIGRAYAGIRNYELAVQKLRAAVEGWRAIGKVPQASYALSELVRILGITRDEEALAKLRAYLEAFFGEVTDPNSRAFVELQLGKAMTLLEHFADALSWLDRVEAKAGYLRVDVLRPAQRWRARALDGLDRREEATATRRGLARSGDCALLASLDEAVGRVAPASEVGELLDALRREAGPIVDPLRAGLGDVLAQARRVADEYPY